MVSRSNSQGVGKDTSDSSNYLQFLHDPYRIIIILRTLRLHARLSKGLKAVSYQLLKSGNVSYEWCSAVVGGALGADCSAWRYCNVSSRLSSPCWQSVAERGAEAAPTRPSCGAGPARTIAVTSLRQIHHLSAYNNPPPARRRQAVKVEFCTVFAHRDCFRQNVWRKLNP